MKLATPTPTPITITIDGTPHVLPSIEAAAPLAREVARFELSSASAHLAAQVRLGAVLWQARQAASREGDYDQFKRLLVIAGIEEHRAQRCMRVASKIGPQGVVDRRLVESLQERARARGKANLPFVSEAPATFKDALRLVAASEETPRHTRHTMTDTESATPGVALSGSDRVRHTRHTMTSTESATPGVALLHGVRCSEDERMAACAREMGMGLAEYREYLAGLDAEEQHAEEQMGSSDAAPESAHDGVAQPEPRLCTHDLEVSPSGTIAQCRKCGFVGKKRDGLWERVMPAGSARKDLARNDPVRTAPPVMGSQLRLDGLYELRRRVREAMDKAVSAAMVDGRKAATVGALLDEFERRLAEVPA